MKLRLAFSFLTALLACDVRAQQPSTDNRPLLHIVEPASLLFAVSGPEDARYVLETSSNLVHWLAVETNLLYGFDLADANYFIPEMFPGGPFYRARQFSYPILNDLESLSNSLRKLPAPVVTRLKRLGFVEVLERASRPPN